LRDTLIVDTASATLFDLTRIYPPEEEPPMSGNKILFFNPRSANATFRIPNSIMSIAATVEGVCDWAVVDGNRESDPLEKLFSYLRTGQYRYIGFTAMPGPQLKQAIPFAKAIREAFPDTIMIWGGYFPSSHYKVTLDSGWVDFIINGPGEHAFPSLIQALETGKPYEFIPNLIFKQNGKIIKTKKETLFDQDPLPKIPYDHLDQYYSLDGYLGKTYLGTRTVAYHSSIGCPFTCSFCAVVPLYEARWKARSAPLVFEDIRYLHDKWGANAIEFHDNNFFVSEKRAVAFSELVRPLNMQWWGMARIDTMSGYSDASLANIREAGCRMIFFGAESGNDEILKQFDKGGTQSGKQIEAFAARMRKFDIIPEYSFVLGAPAPTRQDVQKQIDFDIRFIRRIKEVNPDTEIVVYTYSPVPTEGSELWAQAQSQGFSFPQHLEDWVEPQWEQFNLRKNPLTPWLEPEHTDAIRDFETVLNGYYPTASDIRLGRMKRKTLQWISSLRYKTRFYRYPYEIRLLQKTWKYRQPEIQGF
jgi:anaerobic magnesium-protoporphyrin IX monomethyl ester cyclase